MLHALRHINRQFLVSAYDLALSDEPGVANMRNLLHDAQREGVVILLDSGNYESYWKGRQIEWRPANFHRVVGDIPCSCAFGFDEQAPPSNIDAHVRLISESFAQDQAVAGATPIIPIIHGSPDCLPSLAARVATDTGSSVVAVPERRLGDGVLARMRVVAGLRRALDDTGRDVALHLLGTGNPISITLFAAAGADSFDGLEWCQTVVDHETATLFHLSQADFFMRQTDWGDSNLPYVARVLAHNLEFYREWMRRLREAVRAGHIHDFCRMNFPPRVFTRCRCQRRRKIASARRRKSASVARLAGGVAAGGRG